MEISAASTAASLPGYFRLCFCCCAIIYILPLLRCSVLFCFVFLFNIDLYCSHSGKAMKLDWTGKLHSQRTQSTRRLETWPRWSSLRSVIYLFSDTAHQILVCNSQWMSTQSRVLLEWFFNLELHWDNKSHRGDSSTTQDENYVWFHMRFNLSYFCGYCIIYDRQVGSDISFNSSFTMWMNLARYGSEHNVS